MRSPLAGITVVEPGASVAARCNLRSEKQAALLDRFILEKAHVLGAHTEEVL